jgi:hypothetical protein
MCPLFTPPLLGQNGGRNLLLGAMHPKAGPQWLPPGGLRGVSGCVALLSQVLTSGVGGISPVYPGPNAGETEHPGHLHSFLHSPFTCVPRDNPG